jgi:hypothetical protein
MQRWIIVFVPGSTKTIIRLALAWDYEFIEYTRASRHDWGYEDRVSAARYAKQLAKDNGLSFNSDDPEDNFLD